MGGALFAALAGWIAGAACQLHQRELWPLAAYVAAALAVVPAAAAGWALRRGGARPAAGAVLLMLAAAGGGFAQAGWRAVAFERSALPSDLEGVDLWLTGVVGSLPQVQRGPQPDQRWIFEVERSEALGAGPERRAESAGLPRRVQLTWYAPRPHPWAGGGADEPGTDLPSGMPAATGAVSGAEVGVVRLRAGERWRLPVRLRAPHGNANPHAFDHELWLWERGVQAVGYVRLHPGLPAPQRLAQTWRSPVEQLRQSVRDRIEAQLAAHGQPPRAASILSALVLGDQSAIEAGDWAVFRDTGIAHLVAVSGLHITMFCWLAVAAIGQAWRRSPRLLALAPAPVAALAGGVALAALYALFSGWGVPAQRTVWMLIMVAALRLAGGQWPLPVVWLAAMAVVVAADPWALLQAGFWLSFVAVGVLFAAGPQRSAQVHLQAAEALGARPSGVARGLRWSGLQIQALLREQWLMTLALMPLTLLLFHQMSVVGAVVNLVAIPVVTFVVLPLAMLGVALPVLWNADAWLLGRLMDGLAWCVALPGATLGSAARPAILAVLAAGAGVVAALRLPWRWKLLALPWALPFLLWTWPAPKEGEFAVTALDVGQGQAVLIQTARHALLYDAGPVYGRRGDGQVDAGARVIVPYLRARGVALDRMVLSHADSDHAGGAQAVLAHQPTADWMGSIPADHVLHRLRAGRPCVAGDEWHWDGVSFQVLFPRQADQQAMRRAPNAQSCVLLVDNGRASVLLPGDIGTPQERELLAHWPRDRARRPVTGLLMPHHGSRSSSSDALLRALRPEWALAQAGYRNRFGHPHAQVVARYQRHGVRVFDSPRCGAWRWVSSQPQAFACHRVDAARYWHHRP